MKIISWNVNGLRSVYKKGFLDFLKKEKADIICLQEIKIQENQIPSELINPFGYHSFFNSAIKKGYSGVAVFSKIEPQLISKKLGFNRFDKEGRILKVEYSDFILTNVYIPHGGRKKENFDYKLEVYKHLLKHFEKEKNKKKILIGDFNVAHQEIDLARPKQNRNNTMFTLKERKQIDKIIELGFKDCFRIFNKKGENYTWWPYYRNARQRNLGWRIDYAFVSRRLVKNIKKCFILKEVKGSDHCPIGLEMRL
jgi:exodeoxyribonuclease-3